MTMPRNYLEALQAVKQKLGPKENAEAELLVIYALRAETGLNLRRIDLYSSLEKPFPPLVAERVMKWAQQRRDGIPLQYLTGYQVFLNHEYEVSASVLIPRPETELLVEKVREESLGARFGIEIGLGSGAISIELLSYFPALKMLSSELSPAALEVARRNAQYILGPESFRLIPVTALVDQIWEPFSPYSSWQGQVDFIVSNPPYLLDETETQLQVSQYEPAEALYAPAQRPLFFYEGILEKAASYLKPEGKVFVEIPHERSAAIQALFLKMGWTPQVFSDLNGRDRIVVGKINNKN